jgi:hypothetical protein
MPRKVRVSRYCAVLFVTMPGMTQLLRRWLAKLVLEYTPRYYLDWSMLFRPTGLLLATPHIEHCRAGNVAENLFEA